MKIAPGTLHKYLTGETVTGDDASIATNINKVFDAITTAHNDTDDKVTADVSNLAANYYTKPQTDSALGVRDTNLNNYKTETATNFGIRDSAIAQLSLGQIPPAPNTLPIPISLGNGLQVVNVGVGSPYNVLNIVGRTLINLLGRAGGCESVSSNVFQLTAALDSSYAKTGLNGIKLTLTAAGGLYTLANIASVKASKFYLGAANVKNQNATTNAYFRINRAGSTQLAAGTIMASGVDGLSYFTYAPGVDDAIDAVVTLNGSTGQIAYVDSIRLYEITSTEKTYIDGLSVANAQAYIAAKYPYVDDVKHVNAPYVIKVGENQTPTFNELTSIHANATINAPYDLKHTGTTTGGESSYYDATLIVGQQYTFGFTGTGKVIIACLDSSLAIVGTRTVVNGGASGTFTIPSGTSVVRFSYGNLSSYTDMTNPATYVYAASAFTFTNPMLNLGATAKPFKPRNDDSLFFPNVQLASSVDGMVYDQLFKRDGKYFVERRFKDMVLDGSLTWVYNADFAGYKQVYTSLTSLPAKNIGQQQILVKYDGKILTSIVSATSSDQNTIDSNNNFSIITIADVDSGWGETYVPTAAEIQAWAFGWKMYDASTSVDTPYNGTGTKNWAKIYVGVGTKAGSAGSGVVSGTGTATLPTAPAGAGFQPYKLTYQLAVATFEEIQVDAGMSLHEGLNQIEVGQAVQVREKAAIFTTGTNAHINYLSTISALKNRTSKILTVYKNGKIDSNWLHTSSGNEYGTDRVYTNVANYDPTATYEVTYIALDQYLLSAPVQTVNGEVASNLKTVVDALSMNDADQDARIAANELLARQIYNVPKQTTQAINFYVDVTNGADNNDGSAGKPFKTIQRAVNSLPQFLNNPIGQAPTIYVAPGTYAEDIDIVYFVGNLTLAAISSAQGATNVNSISFRYCKGRFEAQGFTATTTAKSALYALYCDAVIFNTCYVVAAAGVPGIEYTTSIGRIQGGVFSNRTAGIYANNYSHVGINSVGGSGNTSYGMLSEGGSYIGTYTTTNPTGAVNLSTSWGGSIVPASGVLNPWGDNTQANRSRVFVANNATQSINAATATKVLYQQETTDNLAENDSSISRFTAKNTGTYLVSGSLSFSSGMGTAVGCTIIVYKNGAAFRTTKADNGSSSASPMLNFVQQLDLVAGDYMEVYINTSGATVLATNTTLDITRIA